MGCTSPGRRKGAWLAQGARQTPNRRSHLRSRSLQGPALIESEGRGPSPMRAIRIAAAIAVLGPAGVWAADLEVQSTTLIGGRPDVVDGQLKTVAPLYERVGLRARNLQVSGIDDLAVMVDAWG